MGGVNPESADDDIIALKRSAFDLNSSFWNGWFNTILILV